MALHLEGAGLAVVDTPQGFALNEALRRLSDLVKEQRLQHDRDPILAWMASNAVEKSGDKIDGIAALVMALSRALAEVQHPESRISVWRNQS